MTADPAFIIEPIVIGNAAVVALLLLLGLYLTRPSDPAALARHQRVLVAIAVALAAWLAVDFALAQAGLFEPNTAGGPQSQQLVPKIAVGISLPLLIGLAIILTSRRLNEVLARVPQAWIVGVQLYRVVGGVFLYLYAYNMLPREFALPAGIGDVLVGLAALPVAYAVARGYAGSRGLVIAWNIAGIGDLVVAVATGFMSSPGLYQQMAFDAPNTVIGAYPLVMIPLFAVPLSILLHVISLRRVLANKAAEGAVIV